MNVNWCWPPIFDVVGSESYRRPAPLSPAAMARLVARKRFTSKKGDLPMVIALNTRTILSIFRDMKVIKYLKVGWGDDEAVQLAEVLPLCTSATELSLKSNKISDRGAKALAAAFAEGALPKLKVLSLFNNQLGDEGAVGDDEVGLDGADDAGEVGDGAPRRDLDEAHRAQQRLGRQLGRQRARLARRERGRGHARGRRRRGDRRDGGRGRVGRRLERRVARPLPRQPRPGRDGRERTFVSYRDGRERISWPAALVRFMLEPGNWTAANVAEHLGDGDGAGPGEVPSQPTPAEVVQFYSSDTTYNPNRKSEALDAWVGRMLAGSQLAP